MAQVNKDLIQITGLSVNAPLVVDGGANGSYAVAAHQIKWDKSKFNGETFGGTSEGLLTAIETAIANKTVDLSNYTTYSYVTAYATNAAFKAVEAHENAYGHITDTERANLQSAYETAYFTYYRLTTFLDGEGVKDDVIETLTEIQEYISNDVAGAAKMVNNIAANTEAIAANAEAIAQAKLESSEALKNYYDKDEVDGFVEAVNGNIESAVGSAYAYAESVGAIANGAASTAAQAYANAGSAYDRASAAYSYAESVGAVADAAQISANNAYAYAEAVGAVADSAASTAGQAYANAGSAYDRASAAYAYAETSAEHLNNRINDIIKAGIDKDAVNGIIGDYLKDTDLSTDINYDVAFAASETGYFISAVTVTRKGTGNDYDFNFTYSYIPSPKAEDYWEDYVPATPAV
jgi:methyl-accepting chemotaxis protein